VKRIYQAMNEQMGAGRFSVLVTIIRQAGPSPRGIGAKCLLTQDGSLIGTIGGGRLEAQALEEARKIFDSGRPKRLKFDLKGKDVEGTDMLCGGEVEVFLEPVPPEKGYISLFREVLNIYNHGGTGVLATVVDPDKYQSQGVLKDLLRPGEGHMGRPLVSPELEQRLLGRMEDMLSQGGPMTITLSEESGPVDIFVEPIASRRYLYVFGGGHISREVVPLAGRVGFEVVVIDDRKDFADPDLFPEASKVLEQSFEEIMERLDIDEGSFIVIVTRGHLHDEEVLAQALKTNARYIGMIGSVRKRSIIFERLRKGGFKEEDLGRVHSPIGLEIGAETPEEIAVSIVAELIKARAKRLE